MILGIGLDLVSVGRIDKLLEKFGDKFKERIFTEFEINRGNQISTNLQSSFYAKRFAAKEAFSKAAGFGIGKNFNFTDIEINNDNYGKPLINLAEIKLSFLQKHFQSKKIDINLSITDESNLAQAIVIISN